NVENALAAGTTGSVFGVPWKDMWPALWNLKPLQQRTEVLTLPLNITVLNDSYNSNPRAMASMLETLADWPDAGQRIVVAGEMLELGPSSPELHREIGRACARSRVDWLLAVQGDARFFVEGAVDGGLRAQRGYFFTDAEEAGERCRTILQPDGAGVV